MEQVPRRCSQPRHAAPGSRSQARDGRGSGRAECFKSVREVEESRRSRQRVSGMTARAAASAAVAEIEAKGNEAAFSLASGDGRRRQRRSPRSQPGLRERRTVGTRPGWLLALEVSRYIMRTLPYSDVGLLNCQETHRPMNGYTDAMRRSPDVGIVMRLLLFRNVAHAKAMSPMVSAQAAATAAASEIRGLPAPSR